ncbi:hypothetical protein KCP70_18250 [Salmonella enterica subsp. enterica]|nr:hypothetical protein KCP70_18250 [Salmonella enterica subsp. enterica]
MSKANIRDFAEFFSRLHDRAANHLAGNFTPPVARNRHFNMVQCHFNIICADGLSQRSTCRYAAYPLTAFPRDVAFYHARATSSATSKVVKRSLHTKNADGGARTSPRLRIL